MATTIDQVYGIYLMIKAFLFYSWPFLILIWLFVMRSLYKKWPIDAIIIEKRGNNLIKTNDRVGRFTDKFDGLTYYKLQKSKDTIPVYNYDWVMHNVAVPTTIFERIVNLLRGNIGSVFLFKYGSKQYKPINIKEAGKARTVFKEIKNADGSSYFVQIYQPFDVRDKMGLLDFEVIDWDNMNFMVQEQRASIVRRQKSNEFWKQTLIPLGILIITAMICIIAIKLSFDFASSVKGSTPVAPATTPNIPVVNKIIPPAG